MKSCGEVKLRARSSGLTAHECRPNISTQCTSYFDGAYRLIRFVWEELSAHRDPYAIAFRVRFALDIHMKINRAHDAVAKFFVNQSF